MKFDWRKVIKIGGGALSIIFGGAAILNSIRGDDEDLIADDEPEAIEAECVDVTDDEE